MAEEQKELFEELGRKIEVAGDVLFYKLDDIFNILGGKSRFERNREEQFNAVTVDFDKLLDSNSRFDDRLVLLNSTLSSIGNRTHSDLVAIYNGTQLTADLVRTAIEKREKHEVEIERTAPVEERTTISVDNQSTALDNIAESLKKNSEPATPISAENAVPSKLESKLDPVLSEATTFLKNWSSPERVGIALGAGLAVPVVGGISVAAVGLYFVIGRVADAIERISDNVTSIARGGISGLIFGQSSGTSSPTRSNDTAIVDKLVDVRDTVYSTGTDLGRKLSEIGVSTASLNRAVAGISLSSLSSSLDKIADKIDDIKTPDYVSSSNTEMFIQSTPFIDYSYQEKILSVLSSPVQVKLVDLPASDIDRPDEANVFSVAVRPLVDGQVSFQNMLDSNLRRLAEAVAALSEVPRAAETERITRVTDTLNTEMSEDSVEMILGEARMISSAVESIKNEFISFKGDWTARASETGRRIGDLPTQKSMN